MGPAPPRGLALRAAPPRARRRVRAPAVDERAERPPGPAERALVCNEPGGVEVVVDDVLPAGQQASWSLGQLQALAAQVRDDYAVGDLAVIHVLYLDGGTDQDSGSGSVLGLAYTGTSFALFKQSCDATANLVVSPDEVEATVLVHEVGHLLGLVNLLLVRGAVEAHGGSVAVRSSVEEGTTFTARLPLDAGA